MTRRKPDAADAADPITPPADEPPVPQPDPPADDQPFADAPAAIDDRPATLAETDELTGGSWERQPDGSLARRKED